MAAVERWRPVVDFEGAYEVSDLGRVRSVDRIVLRRFGRGRLAEKVIQVPTIGKMLRPGIASNGYPTVSLCGQTHSVHILVLTAFCGRCPPGLEGCHGDGDRTNARLDNLRWDSRSANRADSLVHGTMPLGERKARAKLTDKAAAEILAAKGREPQSSLAARFLVSPAAIQAVHDRRTFKHVRPAFRHSLDEDVAFTVEQELTRRAGAR